MSFLLSVKGVVFRDGDEWKYKNTAIKILREVKITFFYAGEETAE
jgi:hypothetical protein